MFARGRLVAALGAFLGALLVVAVVPTAGAADPDDPVILSPTASSALYEGYTGPFVIDMDSAPEGTYNYAVFRDPVGGGASKLVAGPYQLGWSGVGAHPQLTVKALAADEHLRFKITDGVGHTAELPFEVRPGAAPRCSVVVPTTVRVNAPIEKIPVRLTSLCATLGVVYAAWDIEHSSHGFTGSLVFDGTSTDTWTIFDGDPMGRYLIDPNSARSGDNTEIPQNSPTPLVRRDSHLGISGSRSGSAVTLRTSLGLYSASANGFRPWADKAVAIAYRNCSSCAWHQLRTVTTNSQGLASYRFTATSARDYRVTSGGTSAVWAPYAVHKRV